MEDNLQLLLEDSFLDDMRNVLAKYEAIIRIADNNILNDRSKRTIILQALNEFDVITSLISNHYTRLSEVALPKSKNFEKKKESLERKKESSEDDTYTKSSEVIAPKAKQVTEKKKEDSDDDTYTETSHSLPKSKIDRGRTATRKL